MSKKRRREVRVLLPWPHKGQQQVMNGAKRYNLLCAGRRWRKTTMAATNVTLESALKKRGTYIWGSPTYKQARIAFDEALKGVGRAGSPRVSPLLKIDLINGSRILFFGLDRYDKVRGFTADGVVVDEIQSVKRQAMTEVLLPMLLDTGGWFWGIGTSNGHDHFWEMRQAAKLDPDSATWNAPTLGVRIENGRLVRQPHPLENPHIDFNEMQKLFRQMPTHVFRREFMSDDDAAPGGLVYDTWFDDFDETDTPQGNVTELADYNPDLPVYWGVDDGYVGQMNEFGYYTQQSHPRVIGFYQVQPTGMIAKFDESLAVETRDELQIKEALERPYRRPSYVVVDKSAASLKGLFHTKFGLYTRNSPSDKANSIIELRRWITPDENNVRCFIVHPRCKHTRFEFKKYRYKDGTNEPHKSFDHCMDEGRYFVWTRRQQ